MARPQDIVDGVLYTLQTEPDIPSAANYVGYEPDIDSESIKLPLVEVSTGPMTNVSEMNTDFIGHRTDDSGNRVGSIYQTLYSFELTIAVWTAHGSKFSPRDISDSVRGRLYRHSTSGPNVPLRNSDDDSPIDEVWRFDLVEGLQTDDLGTSPTLRRWQQLVTVNASEQYITEPDEDPIQATGFIVNDIQQPDIT
jgi:hypothetical protein